MLGQIRDMLTLKFLWRRVRGAFLFLIFGVSSLLLLTNVSVAQTAQLNLPDASQSISINNIDSKIIGKMVVTDEQGKGAEMSVDVDTSDEEEPFVPIPPAQQLPYCGNKKSKVKERLHSQQGTLDHHFNTKNESVDSEDVVVPREGENGRRSVVVATLDGRVSLLDQMGKILWSVCTGHLFSSTISSLQLGDRGKLIKLIPSLTGGLYKYDGESLQAMPLNADLLLKRSFKLARDVVITGGKEYRTFGVDIESGLVKYECGIEGCRSPITAEVTSAADSKGIVLVIKKTLQTVRAIDSGSGIERWNFSVGTHELALAGVTGGCWADSSDVEDTPEYFGHNFRMNIPDGTVFGTDDKNEAVWKHKFGSPISQAWILEDSQLKILDPIKVSPVLEESQPSLYVGMHEKQLYVQESHATTKKLSVVMELEDTNRSDLIMEPLQITWKPSGHLSSSIEEGDTDSNKALVQFNPHPFFVYDRDEVKVLRRPAIEAPPPFGNAGFGHEEEDVEELNVEGESVVDATLILGLATLWFWWKEILGISLFTAVILNVILFRPVVYLTRKRTIAEVARHVNLFLRRNGDQEQLQLSLPAPTPCSRPSTSSETLEPGSSPNNLRTRTISNSSTNSTYSDEQLVPFVSQYLKEFEPVQYIGKGAFGTVFEAKKKIDDRTYAVKRIALPDSEKSRDRVMREVKALARLDHKNIVRYFNAWIESPPPGWLEKNDPLWNAFLHSPTSTYEPFTSSGVGGKGDENPPPTSIAPRKDHSEIFVFDRTPDTGDDSFIVFENEGSKNSELSESGIKFIASSNFLPESSIVEESGEGSSDCSSGSAEKPLILSSHRGSVSKFFRRPTTLDIPSSDNSESCLSKANISKSHSASQNSLSIMYLYIQQELCQKRTLQEWLRQEKDRSLKQVMGMFAQLVEAVEYIHSNKLIHRDLKPGNIFLAGGNGSSDGDTMTVKIGDFGLATTLVGTDLNNREPLQGSRVVEIEPIKNSKLTGQVGTQLYMAPEQAQMKTYDHKVDIYSLGLIFFELLVPFSTDMEKHMEIHKLRELKYPAYFIKSHPEQFELIQDMVSHDPNSRPDASEIKSYLSRHLNSDSLRSHSYPENLMMETMNPKKKHAHQSKQEKEPRRIYKTYSAM